MQLSEQHLQLIARQLSIPLSGVRNTFKLLEEGATIPFISRYRKEVTGSLDEVQIGAIDQAKNKFTELEKRRESILNSIEEQGKLTDELRARITKTFDATELEDLYLPYKRKRKTRASVAREKGLEPLAKTLFKQQNQSLSELVKAYITEEVPDEAAALQGARDIIAEMVNEHEQARQQIRQLFARESTIRSKVVKSKKEEAAKYQDYFEFEEKLSKIPSHRLLAIRRGEDEGFLRVMVGPEDEAGIFLLKDFFVTGNGPASEEVAIAVEDGYKRLLAASIETEFRNSSKATADEEAIQVFAENLKQLLLAAPVGQKRTLALDPGYRTGCKVVCLDESGQLLFHTAVYPHPPQKQMRQTISTLQDLVHKYQIEIIAVGNGTAGRETLQMAKSIDFGKPVHIFMVNESGASIYSASAVAREEFPEQDVTVRGAVSIGRRLMDPLAELVKIDAKSIGVGQYQHDVNQTMLRESLDRVVESCVNSVGININTASKHLLTYVSGLGPTLAQNIVDHRTANGQFRSREELKAVKRMGDKAYEQAAGFLRIREATNPLDNTAVHPERYALVEKMAKDMGCTVEDLIQDKSRREQIKLTNYVSDTVGLPTLTDIMKELEKPGLDPRGEAQVFEFSNEVHSMEDLKAGMVLPGIVTNITKFGAFVDVGVKQDGLVHVSQLANKFVKDPSEVVHLSQKVRVRVMEVDINRKRITLSIKEAENNDNSSARESRQPANRPATKRPPRDRSNNNASSEMSLEDLIAKKGWGNK